MNYDTRLLASPSPVTRWMKRALLVATAGVLVVVAFFFITIALVAGAILAAAIAVRWWWIMRRVRAAAKASAPLEGEYTVVSRPELEPHRGER